MAATLTMALTRTVSRGSHIAIYISARQRTGLPQKPSSLYTPQAGVLVADEACFGYESNALNSFNMKIKCDTATVVAIDIGIRLEGSNFQVLRILTLSRRMTTIANIAAEKLTAVNATSPIGVFPKTPATRLEPGDALVQLELKAGVAMSVPDIYAARGVPRGLSSGRPLKTFARNFRSAREVVLVCAFRTPVLLCKHRKHRAVAGCLKGTECDKFQDR
jgi:hypothetical protein